METIKCKECGCVMSAMSEACPMCGTPVNKLVIEAKSETTDQLPETENADVFDEVSGDWIVPTKSEAKVVAMVKEYNEKAREWGYDELIYHPETKTLQGTFIAKEEAKGLVGRTKEKYRNGYLEEDFDKIVKLCGVKWND